MKYLRLVLPYLPFGAVSVLILGPLLLPGYVLTMDMVFTPTIPLPNHVDNTWLLYVVLHGLSIVLPADVVQKLLLLAILLLSGIGMYRFLWQLQPEKMIAWRWAVYIGALIYMVNPFVYDRLMAGQWGVLAGYALLPWFAASLLVFTRGPTWRQLIPLTAWALAMSIVSIHSLGYVVMVVLVALISQWRRPSRLKLMLQLGGVGVGVFVVLSAYWLLPALLGQGRIAESLETFSVGGEAAFQTVNAVGTGHVGAVLGLLGFWQETRGLYAQPIESYALWGLVYLIFMALMVTGAVQAWRHQRRVACTALALVGVGVLIASGIGQAWLTAYVPFFVGFREPQKFAALIALGYGYFGAWVAAWLLTKVRAWRQYVLLGALTLVPLLYTPTLLWGANGQLRATDYPADWFIVKGMVQQAGGKTLILPWHLYMSYGFTEGRIIASPAPAFFGPGAITSDDPELPGVAPQTRHALRETIQQGILPAGARGEPIAAQLRQQGIETIIVFKELEHRQYDYLNTEARVRYDGPTLRLYSLTK